MGTQVHIQDHHAYVHGVTNHVHMSPESLVILSYHEDADMVCHILIMKLHDLIMN